MFASKALPFVLSFAVAGVVGLDLDVNNQDSIKAAAKSLAAGIVAKYDADVKSSSVPGLFEKPYYFWETGTVMNALIGYSHLTGDKQYDAKVSEALVFQKGELDNFMPVNQTATIGNDDQSCWGLAAMTAAEVGLPKPKDAEWITYATNVWENQALRLELESGKNGTCGGGLRWQIFSFAAGYDFKDAWSNGNFFLLSARLAKFTGNATYSQYADKSFKWAKDIGLISETYAVLAGAQATSGCKNINRIFTSATHGIYTEGAALMYNMTKAQNWTQAVNGFVNASSTFQESDVLVEVMCENNDKCDVDQRAYKGVFARTFARAAVAAPIVKDAITKILTASAKAAAKSCEGTGNSVKCPFEWGSAASKYANQSTPIEGNLGEAYNALEVIQGLLYPQAKALNTKGGTTAGVNPSQSGAPTGTGANPPQSTGAAGMVSVSFTAVFVGALFTILGC